MKNGDNVLQEKSQEEIKQQFNELFNNQLNLNRFDTTGIQKINNNEEIIYSAYEFEEENDNYEISIHIPVINIKNDLSNTFNQITQAYFGNKANEVMQKKDTTQRTIYSIDYAAYVNDNILSVVIKSSLKEGNSAQRVIVQTYNYNLSTNSSASLIDLITIKKLNKDEVNNKINQVVNKASQESQILIDMGYNQIYVRDLESKIYNVDNAGAYFLGPNKELYIVYAYGNGEFTSEMDIVLCE